MGSVYIKALAILVALAATSPVSLALAPVQTDPINYEDPNMEISGGYVAEASSSCIQQSGEKGALVTDCMKSFRQSAKNEADVVPVAAPAKKVR